MCEEIRFQIVCFNYVFSQGFHNVLLPFNIKNILGTSKLLYHLYVIT